MARPTIEVTGVKEVQAQLRAFGAKGSTITRPFRPIGNDIKERAVKHIQNGPRSKGVLAGAIRVYPRVGGVRIKFGTDTPGAPGYHASFLHYGAATYKRARPRPFGDRAREESRQAMNWEATIDREFGVVARSVGLKWLPGQV